MTPEFSYHEAFSRNIGLLSELEQAILKHKKVAIAGLGGVGGFHLLSLTRAGFQNFHLAEMDTFELANFNRQTCATISSLNKPKIDVAYQHAKDINPNANITLFPQGVTQDNLDAFLEGVDLFIDGIDFFVLDRRMDVFQRCHELGIPVITAAPLFFSTAYLISLPDQMSFKEYYNFDSAPRDEHPLLFMMGLNPFGKQRKYISDFKRLSFKKQKTTSHVSACHLCAGVTTILAIKILLKKGHVKAIPYAHLFDPFDNTFICKKLPHGNKNIFQKLKLKILKKILAKNDGENITSEEQNDTVELPSHLRYIFEHGIYASSDDNLQPWQFEVINEMEFNIHITIHDNFYEKLPLTGLLAAGCLIKNIEIASQHLNLKLITGQIIQKDNEYIIHCQLEKNNNKNKEADLLDFIKLRTVNRKPYMKDKLTEKQKNHLINTLKLYNFNVFFLEDKKLIKKLIDATLTSYDFRVSFYDSFLFIKSILSFSENDSTDKVPISSFNLDYISKKIAFYASNSWKLFAFINKYFRFSAKYQVEYLPAKHCPAHFIFTVNHNLDFSNPINIARQHIEIGKGLQHFWLELTKMGLVMQPNYGPIMFYHYFNENIDFYKGSKKPTNIHSIKNNFSQLCGDKVPVFAGRIGWPKSRKIEPRSTRKPLKDFIITKKQKDPD